MVQKVCVKRIYGLLRKLYPYEPDCLMQFVLKIELVTLLRGVGHYKVQTTPYSFLVLSSEVPFPPGQRGLVGLYCVLRCPVFRNQRTDSTLLHHMNTYTLVEKMKIFHS